MTSSAGRLCAGAALGLLIGIPGFGNASAAQDPQGRDVTHIRPTLVKACGTISALGTTLEVDISEGRLRTTCLQARHVITTYLARSNGGDEFRKIKLGAKTWHCYKSRPDGAGWDFHCNRMRPRLKGRDVNSFVDVGAGRRF
jgi:hypothetical protein